MFVHLKFTVAAWACALALGLTACSGGGGGGSSGPTAEELREAIEQLVDAADAAVDAVITASGAGAVTPALIDRALAAVAAATAELATTDGLTDAEISMFDREISELARRIAEEQRKVRAAEAETLRTVMAGDRITGISAVIAHGEAPSMSGTVPGTPPVSVAGLETAADGAAHSVDGWQGGTYTAAMGGAVDTVVLYSNIVAPGTRPFAGSGGKYDASALDADGNLPIVAGTDTTLIAAAAFPSGPGIVSHETDPDGTVRVVGSFDGASGAYLCTPAMGGACTSSVRHGGGYTLAGGDWKFVPDSGAEVPDPDTEYQYFGWWLRQTGDAAAIGTFHAGVGGSSDELANLRALQGTATYRGPAVGKFTLEPRIGEASAGDFAATVTLEVDFGDVAGLGTVGGNVENFTVNGVRNDWSVALGSAQINPDGAIAAGGNATALTVWSISGNAGTTPGTPPIWSGQLHDADEHSVPAVATGAFEASYDEVGRMIGAFGTARQP